MGHTWTLGVHKTMTGFILIHTLISRCVKILLHHRSHVPLNSTSHNILLLLFIGLEHQHLLEGAIHVASTQTDRGIHTMEKKTHCPGPFTLTPKIHNLPTVLLFLQKN